MTVPKNEPQDASREAAGFFRDLKRILTAQLVGLIWRDNVGPMLSFIWNSDRAPIRVASSQVKFPHSVHVLRAQSTVRDDLTIHSDCAIRWSASQGDLLIHAIPALTASTDYRVDLGLMRGA